MALRGRDNKKKGSSGGLSPKAAKGLNKKKISRRRGGNFKRLVIEKGDYKAVQFLNDPTEMFEYEQHVWREKGQWYFVPCLDDFFDTKGLCPLCEDDEKEVARTSYQFAANVWSFKDKAVKILTGGQDLAGRIMFRWEKKKSLFLKRTWDIRKNDTKPVTMDIDVGDKSALKSTSKLELFDLAQYVLEEAERYYGDDMPTMKGKKKKTPKRTALDDYDEDDDDESEDEYDKETLLDKEETPLKELKRIASEEFGIKLVDKAGDKRDRETLVRLIMKRQAA